MRLPRWITAATIASAVGIAVAPPAVAASPVGTSERPGSATEASIGPLVFCSTKFIVDGVRIRSQPNTSSTVLGLGYKGQWFDIDRFTPDWTWAYGKNRSTGVKGWVSNTSGFFDVSLCP